MATWLFYRDRSHNIVAGYANARTRAFERLGVCPASTCEPLLVDWVMGAGPMPGDIIRLGAGLSGRVLVVSKATDAA